MTNTFIDDNEANEFHRMRAACERHAEEQQFSAQGELEAATDETLGLKRRRPAAPREPLSAPEEYARHRAEQIARNRAIADDSFGCETLRQQQPEPRPKTLTMF